MAFYFIENWSYSGTYKAQIVWCALVLDWLISIHYSIHTNINIYVYNSKKNVSLITGSLFFKNLVAYIFNLAQFCP